MSTSSTSRRCKSTRTTLKRAQKHVKPSSDSASSLLIEPARCGHCLMMLSDAMTSSPPITLRNNSKCRRRSHSAIATRQARSGSSGTAHTEFETLWSSAEQSTNKQPERELGLARLAEKWGFEKQSEELWLRITKNPPMRREALDGLRRLYRANNETGKLYDVLQHLHESSPKEAPITADLARLGLTLDQNTERSHSLAKEAHDRAPGEVNCAVTYAFSLYRLGGNAEG